MRCIALLTDSGSDLPQDVTERCGITILPMAYNVNGVEYERATQSDEQISDFYNQMRGGALSVTSQINPDGFLAAFIPLIEEGREILYIGLSSGLSGTVNSANMALCQLAESHPDAKIRVVDSLCASMGLGMLVYLTAQKLDEGCTLDEAAEYAEETKLCMNHIFTVDDLMFLKRGGRLSGASALLGTLLHIKPVMYVDNEGHLLVREKVSMRKRAIRALADAMKARATQSDTVFVSHGDASQDCDAVMEACREYFPDIKTFIKGQVGPVIGSHSGPGTLALFFLGRNREDAR